MKKTGIKTKVLLSLIVTLLVIGAMAVVSFAADKTASYDNKYGQIVPTDSKLEARKTSFSFYGDKATLYFMRISKGKSDANYAIEIYSDKNCTKLIRSMSGEYGNKGNRPLAISWSFKNTPSGTYYGKCYTYISRDDGNVIDKDSVETFTIKIDRLSKKVVKLNSISNTAKGIKITWTPLTTAKKYNVFRKAEGETKWTVIRTLDKGAYTYTDSSVKSGKTYKYTVRCYDGKYTSRYDKAGLTKTFLATPTLTGVSGYSASGYAKVTWKAVPGAAGYEIYRKGGSLNNSEFKKIATVKGKNVVNYIDKTATKTDWNYTYSVRAYNGSNKSTYNSDGRDFDYMRAPVLKTASSFTNGVKITWTDASDVVTKYTVYKKTSSGWKKVGTTTKKEFVDTTATSGSTVTYTVKGSSKTNSGAYNSKGISVRYLAVPKLQKVYFDTSEKARVSWSTVKGATGYKVYRKINSAKGWTEIATVKGGNKSYYLDTIAKKSGYTYKYTIRAINGKTKSYYELNGIQEMFLSKPVAKLSNGISENGTLNVKITWKAIAGAEGYKILRQVVGDTKWTTLANCAKETVFYDNTVQNGVKYRYAVRTVNGKSISRYNAVDIIALDRPVMQNVQLSDMGVVLEWNTVEGADTYYVYRKAENGKWEVIGSYALNSFIDTSEEAKTTAFYYTVAAEAEGYKSTYDTVGMKNFVEATEFTAQFNPATDTELPYILVNWTLDDGVESFELFKSIGEDKVSLGEIFGTQYQDFDIAVGTEYTYTIKVNKAGKLSTEKTVSAKYPHAPLEAVEFELTPTYSEDGSFIAVEFTPVEFAEGYEVYRKASADAEWSKIATIAPEEITEARFSFKDLDVDEETTYYYTVKAIASDRDSFYNEDGKDAKIYIPLEPVAGIVAKQGVVTETAEDGTVTEKTIAIIVWDEVENGQYYTVLRKTADSDWELMGLVLSGEDLRYQDYTIEQGVQYTYTVEVSAPFRGEIINEIGAEFLWALPEEPVPEEPAPEEPAPEEPVPEEPAPEEPAPEEPAPEEPAPEEPAPEEPAPEEPAPEEPAPEEPAPEEPVEG